MFLLSSFIKAGLFYASLATPTSFKGRATIDTDSANLELPVNLTNLIQSVNETTAVNETTSPADPFYGDDYIAWPGTAAPPSITLPSPNASLTSAELGAPNIHCNGKAYGKNLKVSSCYGALTTMPRGTKALTFGERGHGDWDGALPYRILSSDGLCAIDISHKANVLSDEISPSDLRQSVELVLQICVKGKPSEGGVVSNIGKNGNLAVRVMPYKPSVRCGPPQSSPPITDCKIVIDHMPADGTRVVFGQKNDTDPKITVKLPASFTRYTRRCQVFIDTLMPGVGQDTWDWYKVWGAATAIEYMCIHRGRNGMAMELGWSADEFDHEYGWKCCDHWKVELTSCASRGEKEANDRNQRPDGASGLTSHPVKIARSAI